LTAKSLPSAVTAWYTLASLPVEMQPWMTENSPLFSILNSTCAKKAPQPSRASPLLCWHGGELWFFGGARHAWCFTAFRDPLVMPGWMTFPWQKSNSTKEGSFGAGMLERLGVRRGGVPILSESLREQEIPGGLFSTSDEWAILSCLYRQ